jgi:hypothetical protein
MERCHYGHHGAGVPAIRPSPRAAAGPESRAHALCIDLQAVAGGDSAAGADCREPPRLPAPLPPPRPRSYPCGSTRIRRGSR